VEEEKEESVGNADELLYKENKIEGYNINADSSDVILHNKEDNSELKIYDIDNILGDNGGETKDNFFGTLDREASITISKKKKKRRGVPKNKKKPTATFIPDEDEI
jgi:hypothetical protein